MSLLWRLLIVFVALSGLGVARAEPEGAARIPESEDYILRSWEMDDGLPNNNVTGIAQTPDGYLWIGTEGGLARFDGLRFASFTRRTLPELSSNLVTAVGVSGAGDLWVGTQRSEVLCRRKDRFERIVSAAKNPSDLGITSFAEATSGAIWMGFFNDAKAARWFKGSLSEFTSVEGISPGGETVVQTDAQGKVWFATKRGCGFWERDHFVSIDEQGGSYPVLARLGTGGMWAVRNRQLIKYTQQGQREAIADMSWLASVSEVSVLYEDSSGNLWVGTRSQGLFRFSKGSFTRVPTTHTTISVITADREGNLWVGTHGGGLNRLRPRRFYLRQTKDGLSHDYVVSLAQDTTGRLWAAGRTGVPARALDASNRRFEPMREWGSNGAVLSLCPDREGGVFLGTMVAGLWQWSDGQFSYQHTWEQFTEVFLDRQNRLWGASSKGALVCRESGTNRYLPKDQSPPAPLAITEDKTGRLWVGTAQGRVFLQLGESFVPVALPGGQPSGKILFLVPDENDTMWIGAEEGQLYRWRSGKVAAMPSSAGLPLEDLRSMAIEPETGDFWLGTVHGLLRVVRKEIEGALDGTQATVRFVRYGINDGLANLQFSLGFRNATTRTRDGHLWFATYRGLLEVDPQELQKTSFPTQIEEIEFGGITRPVGALSALTVPPKPGPVSIRFTRPDMGAADQLSFRYRLAGLHEQWVDSKGQRTVTFASLPAGDYQFEVSAAEAGEPWSAAVATLGLHVRAAWWETLGFRIGVGAVASAVLIGLVRLVVKRRMRMRLLRIKQAHELERERIRIARDMHDEFGASLTHIAFASEFAKQEASESVARQIGEIAEVARVAAESLNEIVWAINPRHDKLSSLLEYIGKSAIQFVQRAGMACEVDLPRDLPDRPLASSVRHHLFLAVRECLNNAAKYSHASKVCLRIALDAGVLRIVIADNGCGFASPSGSGNGLRNMRERMGELGGRCEIESAPGRGTRVAFELPLPEQLA